MNIGNQQEHFLNPFDFIPYFKGILQSLHREKNR
jgi:hypothetical protein